MKSAVETLNPTRVRLTVEVPFEELQPSLDAAYKRISSQVTIPGFRKGKVPSRLIDQRFGRAMVLEEAVNDALPKLYVEAVRSNELQPLGTPEVDVTDFSDGGELKFTAEVDIRPEITLPRLEDLTVGVSDADPSEEEVDEQLHALRERFGTLTGVERPAAAGDFVVIDLSATADGVPVEGAQASGLSYQVGRGTMLDGLDETLIGMSEGEQRSFRTTLVGGDHQGQEVDCSVTVKGVKEQDLPELDDSFAELASEYDTLAELRDDLRTRLERVKRLTQAVEARDKVLDALLATVDVPLPDSLLNAQLDEHFETEHGEEGHRDEVEDELRKSLKTQLVLDEVARAEQVSVDQEELTEHIVRRAQQAGIEPDEFIRRVVEANAVGEMATEVARAKALATVVESATVTDASGRHVELLRLQEDGTLAPETDDEDDAEQDDAAYNDAAGDGTAPDDAIVVSEPAGVGGVERTAP